MAVSQKQLIDAAVAVRANAYCHYSGYRVGAALVDENGELHIGCNVENSAFPEGTCAEANAIAAMIASGGKSIKRIAVVGGRDAAEDCTPCGGCRQKIAEFADEQTEILLVGADQGVTSFAIDDLLPLSYRLI